MAANGKHEHLRLGFLTAIEMPDRGFVGGLLVTNHCGRPLEFQCTAPVKPNATQEILYGPTLEPFLLGELIGGTLVDKAGVKPQWILTDRAQILELRNHIEQPMALVSGPDEPGLSNDGNAPRSLKLGRQMVRFHPAHACDGELMSRDSAQIPDDADLQEPFERVREALQETLRSGALK
ncbi:MAG TPA: hypothetical protein VL475_10190 [Planctomycetaceae bacterium]|jgi:hypothetical protein|nr:hypothetical protein [Planctomycetaceae bacterium]